ncbi:uncharacterized protein PGTG_02343 [Puccinia graminis f. sp. tritici CRL 75-36-700-3]|uniref:Hydrophobin n=1 Tax=Puccinia graminis f. sp. tritici (strain CRL 75-36-700-3 / race SCCL) TaxID=418459 RepID=E3JXV7_PUCGT|nr:uncharacterized protein PGTG_02343 [Puccinia graminis f. sp. tritici CRL 75-36-700-3]EFP76882.1 hypothetical protein PGTG_02343 [Puccinia graminis f. sp. tritici CRL 75-36-700-3]
MRVTTCALLFACFLQALAGPSQLLQPRAPADQGFYCSVATARSLAVCITYADNMGKRKHYAAENNHIEEPPNPSHYQTCRNGYHPECCLITIDPYLQNPNTQIPSDIYSNSCQPPPR